MSDAERIDAVMARELLDLRAQVKALEAERDELRGKLDSIAAVPLVKLIREWLSDSDFDSDRLWGLNLVQEYQALDRALPIARVVDE